jgi:hypothetical protein
MTGQRTYLSVDVLTFGTCFVLLQPSLGPCLRIRHCSTHDETESSTKCNRSEAMNASAGCGTPSVASVMMSATVAAEEMRMTAC